MSNEVQITNNNPEKPAPKVSIDPYDWVWLRPNELEAYKKAHAERKTPTANRFHLNTIIGEYHVSTVGPLLYRLDDGITKVLPMGGFLASDDFQQRYETIIFWLKRPKDGIYTVYEWSRYTTAGEATEGHIDACRAAATGEFPQEEGF